MINKQFPAALFQYIPEPSHDYIARLIQNDQLVITIKNERKTRHGDYKQLATNQYQITVNNNLNQYRFLITLVHEIAHFETYQKYHRVVKPHGKEWKYTFQRLMLPLINPTIFPTDLVPLIANHFRNPKASSDTDVQLSQALRRYDLINEKTYIHEIKLGTQFKIYNGRTFKRGKKRTKRYECLEISSGKLYLFNANAEVEIIDLKAAIK